MSDEPKNIGLPIGGASLLMIFIVLCLTTFAAISFVAANNDYQLSKKTAENVSQYYAIDNLCEEFYADISKAVPISKNKKDLLEKLKKYDMITSDTAKSFTVTYSPQINDNLSLEVKLEIDLPAKKCKILSWSTKNTHIPDDSPVYLDIFGS